MLACDHYGASQTVVPGVVEDGGPRCRKGGSLANGTPYLSRCTRNLSETSRGTHRVKIAVP